MKTKLHPKGLMRYAYLLLFISFTTLKAQVAPVSISTILGTSNLLHLSSYAMQNWYLDKDDDGYSTGRAVRSQNSPGRGYKNAGIIAYEDCNDDPITGGRINKGVQEVCNGIDDDCDGLIDNADPSVTGRISWYLDKDDDGYSTGPAVLSCTSPGPNYKSFGVIAYEDCNDDPITGGRINKGVQEVCNGIDDDCDGLIDNADPSLKAISWYLDKDDDGYSTGPAVLSCTSPGPNYKSFGVIAYEDCNDDPATGGRINKGVQEVCNGIDDDCDGLIDNADPSVTGRISWYLDKDDDGYSTGPAVLSCTSPGPNYKSFGVIAYEDCNDDPATGGRINKGVQEVCNGIDDDCDGLIDNADPSVSGRISWYLDKDDDGYSTGPAVLSCTSPGPNYKSFGVIAYEDCNDDPLTGGRINKGVQEVCNGIDDDCDGLIDNADPSVTGRISWYLDKDDDGYSTGPAVLSCTSPGPNYKSFGVIAYEDCNDDPLTGGRINKGVQEVCNGIDDDCDGLIDNADPSVSGRISWYLDKDDDGYSTGPAVLSCTSPGPSYKSFGVIAYEDCNDDPATGGRINKGVQEVCNGIDDDCDGLIDNADPSVSGRISWYLDKDDDGYSTGPAVLSCTSPGPNYKSFGVIAYEDCNDDPATGGRINKGVQEVCNGIDDDCDGLIDQADPSLKAISWYLDKDDDGYSTGPAVLSCTSPGPNYKSFGVIAYEDCNDDPATGGRINKGVQEVCNGIDDDCDGLIDNADPSLKAISWYLDKDDDGYSTGPAVLSCTSPGPNYKSFGVIAYEDCNDDPITGGRINKGAPEVVNGKDDNCNGLIDEGATTSPTASLGNDMRNLKETVKAMQLEASVKSTFIKAYPNPTNNFFTLTLKNVTDEKVQVKVFDLLGREVFSANGSANQTYRFGEKFAKGSYVTKVLQGSRQTTLKLVKE